MLNAEQCSLIIPVYHTNPLHGIILTETNHRVVLLSYRLCSAGCVATCMQNDTTFLQSSKGQHVSFHWYNTTPTHKCSSLIKASKVKLLIQDGHDWNIAVEGYAAV